MRGLVLSLYLAVFLALFGLDYGIGRYYASLSTDQLAEPNPGYELALSLAARQLQPILNTPALRDAYLADNPANLTLEPLQAVPLPQSFQAQLDQGQIITLESDSGLNLYKRLGKAPWLLRLDLPTAQLPQQSRARYGLTLLFYAGVAAILLLWATPLLRGVRQLNRAAKKMGEGQLDTRVAIAYGDYLGPLKSEFNAMASKLQALNENNQLLSQAVSHELRTPLARMRFALDLLAGRDTAARRQQDINRIERDIDAMEALISELLNYARLDKAPELDLQKVDVSALLVERIRLFSKLDCPIQFEPSPKPQLATLDPDHFSKVVDNLLQNACRHARSVVSVYCEWQADRFILSVDDDGPGVPADQLEAIFKPFLQLARPSETEATSKPKENFGLGLAIAARLVHWHGGQMRVTRAEQLGGASFRVEWPRAPGDTSG